ncbi:low temperature requirement protein A [Streptomyces sp. 7N604]|uniref:low temperature requirement protein A n=1 Tax=Streptomyces sp. 7N604 TaxID=3457415 RepID=UPI003FD4653F
MIGIFARFAQRFTAMPARDPDEGYRTATVLELFFDLVFVVALAQGADGLHHAIVEGHPGTGTLGYVAVFFAIWWAWVNWTWFASAFDCDDALYRIATFAQMFGALWLAAGVPEAYEGNFAIAVTGYVIMRLALVSQWLRAAAANPGMRPAALRFAIGITAVQVCWVARLALPQAWAVPTFALLWMVEMAIPWWAEHHQATPWHPEHIAERYVLFTMIVLGESVLAATLAIQSAVAEHASTSTLVGVAISGFTIVCSMWWLYNSRPAGPFLHDRSRAFPWGYGHYAIFGAIAAVGTGISVMIDHRAGKASEAVLSTASAGATVAIPTAIFLFSVWCVHIKPHRPGRISDGAYLLGTALVLLTPLTPAPLELTAATLVAVTLVTEHSKAAGVRPEGPASPT